jgi:predicted transcriptional regulator
MDKKMTYTTAIENAITAITKLDCSTFNRDETVEKLTALKDQLVKRNASKSTKPTKTQRENIEVKAQIKEFLTHTLQGVKCGDVATACGISGQKASALLSQMVTAGEVVKRMDKRTALFLLPENDMSDPANS